jgi:hypothetical protein
MSSATNVVDEAYGNVRALVRDILPSEETAAAFAAQAEALRIEIQRLSATYPEAVSVVTGYLAAQEDIARYGDRLFVLLDDLHKTTSQVSGAIQDPRLGAGFGIVRNWVDTLGTGLQRGVTGPLREIVIASGSIAAVAAMLAVWLLLWLMVRSYRAKMYQLRRGTLGLKPLPYTVVSSSTFVGMLAAHAAVQFFLVFAAIWAVLFFAAFQPVRSAVLSSAGPIILGIFSVTLLIKVVLNLATTYFACDGSNNVRHRGAFEILSYAITLFGVVTSLATTTLRAVALILAFAIGFMRLDIPLIAHPMEVCGFFFVLFLFILLFCYNFFV